MAPFNPIGPLHESLKLDQYINVYYFIIFEVEILFQLTQYFHFHNIPLFYFNSLNIWRTLTIKLIKHKYHMILYELIPSN
jgi:hypothetical protein